jgi:hypothetical protein
MDSVFSANDLVEDLQLLEKRVRETHQNPFTYCTEAQLDSAFAAATDSVMEGATFLEFAGYVASALSVLKDSHTYLNFSMLGKHYKRSGGLYLNFSVLRLDNGNIVIENDGQDILPSGSLIFTINGHNVYELYDQVEQYSIFEGNSKRGNRRITDAIFSSVVSMIIPVDSLNKVEYKSPGDRLPQRIEYPGKDYKTLKSESKKKWKITPDRDKEKTYDLEFFPDDSLALLTIGSFAKGRSGKYYRFLRRSFREIRKKEAKYLAIDLRDNMGGQTNRMEEVFTYFSEEKFTVPTTIIARQSEISKAHYDNTVKNFQRFMLKLFFGGSEKASNYLDIIELPVGTTDTLYYDEPEKRSKRNFFDGDVYLFVNGKTGSAGVNFAGCFQNYKLGEVIGEPCLGPLNGTWGNPAPYQMKNSGLNVYISTIRSNTTDSFETDPTPLSPGFYVAYDMKDLFHDRDTQLQFLMEMLREK